jgi:hypothetical protein
MANHILRAHGCADTGAKRTPIHPVLDSLEPPELPGTKPQPIPHIEGVDLSLGFSRSIPGMLSSLRPTAPRLRGNAALLSVMYAVGAMIRQCNCLPCL